jgi:hypothetical protein
MGGQHGDFEFPLNGKAEQIETSNPHDVKDNQIIRKANLSEARLSLAS